MRQLGFTLIELVVTVTLLGILTATALPRFVNLSDAAHSAALSGVAGAFASAINLARAQNDSQVGGPTDVIDFGNVGATNVAFGINESTTLTLNPYPVSGDGNLPGTTVNATNCFSLFASLLSSAPGVSDTAGPGVTYVATGSTTVCTYTYQPDTTKSFAYNYTNGVVTVVP